MFGTVAEVDEVIALPRPAERLSAWPERIRALSRSQSFSRIQCAPRSKRWLRRILPPGRLPRPSPRLAAESGPLRAEENRGAAPPIRLTTICASRDSGGAEMRDSAVRMRARGAASSGATRRPRGSRSVPARNTVWRSAGSPSALPRSVPGLGRARNAEWNHVGVAKDAPVGDHAGQSPANFRAYQRNLIGRDDPRRAIAGVWAHAISCSRMTPARAPRRAFVAFVAVAEADFGHGTGAHRPARPRASGRAPSRTCRACVFLRECPWTSVA